MNSKVVINTLRFIGLLLLQVLVFNHIYFMDFMNPAIYIAFIFLYPLEKERGTFITLSFLLGLCVDISTNSGGINAAASVFIAYIRIFVLDFVQGKSDYDYVLFNLKSLSTIRLVSYIFILTTIHQFIVFTLEFFSANAIGEILYKALLSSIFSTAILVISILLFTKKR